MKQLHSKVVCIATVVVVTAFAQAQTNEVASAAVRHCKMQGTNFDLNYVLPALGTL